MTKMKKIFISTVAMTLVLGVAAGCTKKTSSTEKVIFRMPLAEIEGLDASHASYSQTITVLNAVNEALYTVNDKGEIVTGVAKKDPEISKDGLTYTVELRDDSFWVNNKGEKQRAVTAEDFIYSWKRSIDPRSASEYGYIFEAIAGYEDVTKANATPEEIDAGLEKVGIKALSDTEIEIKLAYVAPYFNQILAFQILDPQPKELVEKAGNLYGQSAENTWYNGPYYASTMDKVTKVVATKNPEYWDKDKVVVEEIHYITNTDTQASLNAYNTGEFDYSLFPNDQAYKEAQTSMPDDIVDVVEAGVMGLFINLDSAPSPDLKNQNVRLALQSATDSKVVAEEIVGSGRKSLYSYIPKGLTSAYGTEYTDINGALTKFDLKKAKELIAKGATELGKTPADISVSIMFSENDVNKKMSEYLKNVWEKELGIKVTLDQRVSSDYVTRRRNGDFDIAFGGWSGDFGDPSNFLGLFSSQYVGSLNTPRLKDPEFDKAYIEAVKIQDIDKRLKAFAKLEKDFMATGAFIPMFQRGGANLVNPAFTYPTDPVFKVSPKFMTYKETK